MAVADGETRGSELATRDASPQVACETLERGYRARKILYGGSPRDRPPGAQARRPRL